MVSIPQEKDRIRLDKEAKSNMYYFQITHTEHKDSNRVKVQ